MLDTNEVDGVVRDALRGVIGSRLSTVRSESSTDWEGADALRVQIALRNDAEVTSEERAEARLRVQQDLQRRGEDRFAYLRWLTEQEWTEQEPAEAEDSGYYGGR